MRLYVSLHVTPLSFRLCCTYRDTSYPMASRGIVEGCCFSLGIYRHRHRHIYRIGPAIQCNFSGHSIKSADSSPAELTTPVCPASRHSAILAASLCYDCTSVQSCRHAPFFPLLVTTASVSSTLRTYTDIELRQVRHNIICGCAYQIGDPDVCSIVTRRQRQLSS